MRIQLPRTAAVAGAAGAAAGCVVALVAKRWVTGDVPGEFGWFSAGEAPDRLVVHPSLADSWWGLLWPAALVGALVAVVGVCAFTWRRPAGNPLLALALAAVGVVLGAAVGGVLFERAGPDDVGTPRRYVDYVVADSADSGGSPYQSDLTITLDQEPSNTAAFVGVCAGAGLLTGLFAAAGTVVVRRRSRRSDWSSRRGVDPAESLGGQGGS